MTNDELADRLAALRGRYSAPWEIWTEPHNYPDGTAHFTHVRFQVDHGGEKLTVEVARYVTPELAELLCLLHNSLDAIIPALKRSAVSEPRPPVAPPRR